MRVRIDFSAYRGPGERLITGVFLGDTVSRQTFDTQFVLDVSSALGVSPCRVYVVGIARGDVHHSWEARTVLVGFRIYPSDVRAVHSLTLQVQDPGSKIYEGEVTRATDQLYGIVAIKWDFSLKLNYAISVVGHENVEAHGTVKFLNQGSERWCEQQSNTHSAYCEFEWFFRDDMSKALDIEHEQVEILFVKKFGQDSVLVSFRFVPTGGLGEHDASWIDVKLVELFAQIEDKNSALYHGNVTVAVDKTWGISGSSAGTRTESKRLHYSRRSTTQDSYERCKSTQRCSRGWLHYNQTTGHSLPTMQIFAGGRHQQISHFSDFENWRQGTRGWRRSCLSIDEDGGSCHPLSLEDGVTTFHGGHWSPFSFLPLGPSVPSYNSSSNNGLVLNNASLTSDVTKQLGRISEVKEYMDWLEENMEVAILDATRRSRIDVKRSIQKTYEEHASRLIFEKAKLMTLSTSQCIEVSCNLLFNTSNLELRGAINATGSIATTPDGTEVAVWAFDSINLAREVNVTLTGQRAIALLSRSSVYINTTFDAQPGTLGGFPGGYSVGRKLESRLKSVCPEWHLGEKKVGNHCPKLPCCPGDQLLSRLKEGIISNNVNGPGSGSLRVYLKTIETIAPIVKEVQTVTSNADQGQTIRGGFYLHFNGYNTSFLPHDISASELKREMEGSLNAASPILLDNINRTFATPGIGKINVSRKSIGTSGGYVWSITFHSAIGNLAEMDSGPLTVSNLLNGLGATISVATVTHGNTIGGNFTLSFLGDTTQPLNHDISSSELRHALLTEISSLSTVDVIRTDPIENCNDGFCDNGPTPTGGYIWTLTMTTKIGNLSPFSPTSEDYDSEGIVEEMTAISHLTGCSKTICPSVIITDGHERSHVTVMKKLHAPRPFSLAFGGVGAGHGGAGGNGFGSHHPAGESYGDKFITNLHGGSGGGIGYLQPFEINMFERPNGRGGSGGGAIEIIAVNDIVIGKEGRISCNGENGFDGWIASGGGGSGGAILLAAGGTIRHEGTLSADGGNGGVARLPNGRKDAVDGHGGAGAGGRIAMYAQSLMINESSTIGVTGGLCSSTERLCHGEQGTFYQDEALRQDVTIDWNNGAAGTIASLYLKNAGVYHGTSLVDHAELADIGPEFHLGHESRPGRVSFFVRVGEGDPVDDDWGASFELREHTFEESVEGIYNSSVLVGLFIGKDMTHGADYYKTPRHVTTHFDKMKVFYRGTILNRWYKVDIRLNWALKTYQVYLDDVLLVKKASFRGDAIMTVGLSNHHEQIAAWFDEIYLGEDATMTFECPSIHNSKVEMIRPMQKGWKASDIGGKSFYHDTQRHQSHLSRRLIYNRDDNGGLVPFDGEGHRAYNSDIKTRFEEGDHRDKEGEFSPGSLLLVPSEVIHSGYGMLNTYVWYGEHDNFQGGRDEGYLFGDDMRGGVAACSTQDFITWKNEGIMLNYANLTDTARGSNGPFHIERPKVIFNNSTKTYVMWMTIENKSNDLGMAAVAVSDYPDGPFDFVGSFFPDGNRTRDQTVFQTADGSAYLVRTYYASVEYILPAPIMQPIWESAKNADGTVNFPLSYHRANYEPGYDDYHDIYLQRWRNEDKPWKVVCINKITGEEREVPYGKEHLNDDGHVCHDPIEHKRVLGQGSPLTESSKDGIKSRFLDPNDPINSVWKPSSVPGVKAQPWSANYKDGTCGKRKMDLDMQRLDPSLPDRIDRIRDDCSNIADNPIHHTAPDKLIGPQQLVETRRAKYVSVSRLTDDYLDTNGIIVNFEGELEDEIDLIGLLGAEGHEDHSHPARDNFGWERNTATSQALGSTFHPPVTGDEFRTAEDWDTRFHQYEENFNDRAFYSTACVLDGNCPVNFRNEISEGHV